MSHEHKWENGQCYECDLGEWAYREQLETKVARLTEQLAATQTLAARRGVEASEFHGEMMQWEKRAEEAEGRYTQVAGQAAFAGVELLEAEARAAEWEQMHKEERFRHEQTQAEMAVERARVEQMRTALKRLGSHCCCYTEEHIACVKKIAHDALASTSNQKGIVCPKCGSGDTGYDATVHEPYVCHKCHHQWVLASIPKEPDSRHFGGAPLAEDRERALTPEVASTHANLATPEMPTIYPETWSKGP